MGAAQTRDLHAHAKRHYTYREGLHIQKGATQDWHKGTCRGPSRVQSGSSCGEAGPSPSTVHSTEKWLPQNSSATGSRQQALGGHSRGR
jgi:hypothetical protein